MSAETIYVTDDDPGIILTIRYRPTGEQAWCYSVAPHREMVDDIQDDLGWWDIEAVILTPQQLDELPEFKGW